MTVTIKRVKHYEILEPIGKGGMGEVYLALDTILDRKVAIKFLPEETQQDHTSRERFIREAKSAASLDHPFICKIYEAGEVDGKAYIVMEFIEGEDLGERLKKDPLPLRDSLNVALEIAEALEKAHKNNIVHRDLKPANIMLTPQGHVKVMDFGLAKKVLPSGEDAITKTITQASITEQGMIAGTLAYMSPEQARGEEVDQRSDIFALGIVLQEMLSGMHPFTKPSAIETLSAILRDPAPHPNIKPKTMSPILFPILRRSLAKDPNERYGDIADFAHDIRKAQKVIIGGGSFLRRVLPIAAASVVVIALLVFALLKFIGQPKAPFTESTPESISVIIADVQNQTGDAVFDGVLEKLLSISLDSASYISVYDRKQARQKMIQLSPGSQGKLTLESTQLLSRREGINAVISASIEQSDGGYLVKAWALDPTSSDKIAEVSQTIGTKADILKVADFLSAKLRADLGLIPPDSTEALIKETFTTSSLEAMNAYALAQELADKEKLEEALSEYLKALDYDPNFGRAYSSIAVLYYNRGQYQDSERYFQEAFKRIDQMTDREKYRTRGSYYLMKRDFKNAIDQYSSLVKQFPGDYTAHAMLGLAYFFARNMEKAVEEGRIDVNNNPQSINGRFNLSWYALAAGDFQIAENESRSILETSPEVNDANVVLALAQLAQDRPEEAIETYRKLKAADSRGSSLATSGLADIAIYEGRLSDAVKLFEEGIDFDLENNEDYIAAEKSIMLAQALLLQNKKSLAKDAVDKALETEASDDILFSAALIYLYTDNVEKARALAAELSKRIEPEPLIYAKLIGGEMSRARGDLSNAINLFQEAQGQLDTWLGHFLLGKTYLEAKGFPQAYAEFEQCLKRKGEAASVFLNDLPSFHYLPPLYYYLGLAQEGLESEAASQSYGEFLKIKGKDDGSDPMVEDARRRLDIL
jgi:tetratricopeptide (TPR) repeat protein/tRNA A-37 threonylcarbamoyl transferase component Bud32